MFEGGANKGTQKTVSEIVGVLSIMVILMRAQNSSTRAQATRSGDAPRQHTLRRRAQATRSGDTLRQHALRRRAQATHAQATRSEYLDLCTVYCDDFYME